MYRKGHCTHLWCLGARLKLTALVQASNFYIKMSEENPSVTIFRDYLRIKTAQPNPDYESAVNFLRVYAKEVGLEFHDVEPYPGNPFAWMTWRGSNSSLSSVLLYSHMDVVPVYQEKWDHDPFGAFKDTKGNIHGRGTQDMKSIGIQYVEAVRKLMEARIQPVRDVHIVFGADEELGGKHGMKKFVQHDAFKKLNVGVVIDEGLPTPDSVHKVYYGERCGIPLVVTCSGNAGHGSQFIQNTAAEKMQRILNDVLKFRTQEEQRLKSDPNLRLGDVFSVNLTMIEGGVHVSTVPDSIKLNFDVRAPPTADFQAFKEKVARWMDHSGVTYNLDMSAAFRNITDLNKASHWWNAVNRALDKLGMKHEKEIFPAGTDSKFVRKLGYPAFGFSPLTKTPILLHDHNEFLNEGIFLEGIQIYQNLISELACI